MLITRVELQNTKSYRDQTVAFGEGTNAICGENGSGKSTLLESIGFALFNYLPNTQADFVREGERTATIAVHFVSSADGREYQVVRRCGGSTDHYVFDPELGTKVTTGRADTSDWLREHLGVESNTDPAALFRDAVGVPQGLLTAVFLQTPAQRKPTFDRLLEVEEYEKVNKELLAVVAYLKDESAVAETRISGLRARLQRLPGLREQAEALRAELSAGDARLAELTADLGQATSRRETLEAVKREMDEVAQQARQLSTRLQAMGDYVASGQQAVTQAESAQAIVVSSRAGYEAYQVARKDFEAQEAERQQRDQLRDRRAGHARNRDLASAHAQRLQADLDDVEQATAQMAVLQPQVERQAQIERDLQAARESVQMLEIVQSRADERQSRLQELQKRLTAVESELETAARLDAELREVQTQLDVARSGKVTIASQQATLQAEADRLKKQTGALEAAETATCPVCEQPLTPHHREELLGRNHSQMEEMREQYRLLNQQASEAATLEKELSARSAGTETRLRRLSRPAERDDLAVQIEKLQQELAAAQAQITALTGSQEQAAGFERELAELGDPRRECDRLAARADKRAQVEAHLEEQRRTLASAAAALAEVEQLLLAYADLDQRLEAQLGRLTQHEADHQRYLQSSQLAAELPARRQRINVLLDQQAALTHELEALHTRHAEVSAHFEVDELVAALQREETLKREQATLQGQRSVQQNQIALVEQDIEALAADTAALAAEEASRDELKDLRTTVEFLREVIRQAGPHVIRRLVQQVSLQASRLFGAIMEDNTARLHWRTDYGIVLETNGRERDFEQLSGGEQMAAALAVRLGLLRELSGVDVAFFDEPTSNLDETRRDNLAEQILAVKDSGFSQLFVISHDDTFEQVTDHVIRVRKERGESLVEVMG